MSGQRLAGVLPELIWSAVPEDWSRVRLAVVGPVLRDPAVLCGNAIAARIIVVLASVESDAVRGADRIREGVEELPGCVLKGFLLDVPEDRQSRLVALQAAEDVRRFGARRLLSLRVAVKIYPVGNTQALTFRDVPLPLLSSCFWMSDP